MSTPNTRRHPCREEFRQEQAAILGRLHRARHEAPRVKIMSAAERRAFQSQQDKAEPFGWAIFLGRRKRVAV